ADEGPGPRTETHLRLASQAGVPALAVVLTRRERAGDDGLVWLAEVETRQLLCDCGLPGDDVPSFEATSEDPTAWPGDGPPDDSPLGALLDLLERPPAPGGPSTPAAAPAVPPAGP